MVCLGRCDSSRLKPSAYFSNGSGTLRKSIHFSFFFGKSAFTFHAWGIWTCSPINLFQAPHWWNTWTQEQIIQGGYHLSTNCLHIFTYWHILSHFLQININAENTKLNFTFFKIFRILWLNISFERQIILTHSLKDICVHVPTSNFNLHPRFGGSDVKNQPAMPEIWFRSLSSEDPLEEGMAAHSNILAWRIPMDRQAL